MRSGDPTVSTVRWGVIGTANIAARSFLPALRAAGGRAVVVGSRTGGGAADWAAANEVDRAGSYRDVVDADDIDAAYIALPNEQHARWAAAACAAGKAVLCEKPLTLDAVGAADLVAATGSDALLWESFVFPFHPQTAQIQALIAGGHIGAVREIASEFHFNVGGADNIRLRPEHGGGALYDVGCYPVRLARLVFASEPLRAVTATQVGPTGVDLDAASVVDFPGEQRLVLSAGMRRPMSTFSRIIGTEGELRVSNPFHPRASDTVELWTNGSRQETWTPTEGTAFQHAIEHIHRVLGGDDKPRFRAADDAVGQARALDMVRLAAETSVADPTITEGPS